jgi:hypothetical protein
MSETAHWQEVYRILNDEMAAIPKSRWAVAHKLWAAARK